ncbi:MAG: hypothetical protein GY835_26575 [bacterium]|nr:hypothetical protein [bacterium]
MKTFRTICRWLHRELGFLAVGLTIVYAISGIAVNHKHDWNPNYLVAESRVTIPAVGAGQDAEAKVLTHLGITQPDRMMRISPEALRVIADKTIYDVNLRTGEVEQRDFSERPFFFQVNQLHLNLVEHGYTIVSDIFAGILVILAISGIFLTRGRRGLIGRGGVLMLLGIVLPIVYIILQSRS